MNKKNLTQEQIDELFREYKISGSLETRDKLFHQFSHISAILARRFIGRGIEYEDIMQVASISLLRAIDRYDVERGIKFQSFVVPTIVGEIKNYFRDNNQSIKVSRRKSEAIKKLKLAISELTIEYERAPTTKQIAKCMDMTEENVLELLEIANNINVTSLDSTDDGEENAHRVKLGEYDKGFEIMENRQILIQSLKALEEREKKIIIERFFNNKSQQIIAQQLKVSQMYVSRAEKKALKKLRDEIVK